MQEITGEKPAMWGSAIVGFGAHRYKYESGREGDMPKGELFAAQERARPLTLAG